MGQTFTFKGDFPVMENAVSGTVQMNANEAEARKFGVGLGWP
ncbi:hypothetical protein [Streptomyces fructofermentans]|nr:hypothetical protein [Streptomyces fructofermentans]